MRALEAERLDATQQYDRIISDRAVLAARLDAIDQLRSSAPDAADIRRKVSPAG